MSNNKSMMRLVYFPANIAWAFVFGRTLTTMGGHPMFFTTKREAVAAAAECGLIVTRDRYVRVDPAKCEHPEDARVETTVRAAEHVHFSTCGSCGTTLRTY